MNNAKLNQLKKRILASIKQEGHSMSLYNEEQGFFTDGHILLSKVENTGNSDLIPFNVLGLVDNMKKGKVGNVHCFFPRLPAKFNQLSKDDQSCLVVSAHGDEYLGVCETCKDQFLGAEPIINLGAKYVKWILDLCPNAEFYYFEHNSLCYVQIENWVIALMPHRAMSKQEKAKYEKQHAFLDNLRKFLYDNRATIEEVELLNDESPEKWVESISNYDELVSRTK
jgi:hypothetical protein